MKVNFNIPFKNYKGEDMQREVEVIRDGKKVMEKQPVIIADVLSQNLYSGEGIEKTGNAEKDNENKFKAYKLCHRIFSASGPIDLSPEESILIKQVSAATLTAGAYGQIVELLEGKE